MASSQLGNRRQPKVDAFEFKKDAPHIHHMMQWLSQEHSEKLIISYPNTQGEYNVNLTGSDMERLTAFAASKYAEAFKKLPNGDLTGDIGFGGLETKIVATVSASTLSSFISIIALHRVGLSTMLISPRLADSGYAHLLRVAGVHTVVAGATSIDTIHRVKKSYEGPMDIVPMLADDEILAGLESPRVELPQVTGSPGFIIHTGGTTGLPKPITFHGLTWLSTMAADPLVLSTVPNFHSFGIGSYIRALRCASHLFLLNGDRPVTAGIVWKALDTTGARILHTVPYTLKFFAEMEGGPERLAALDQVFVGGSAAPDDLGDMLVRTGIKLYNGYGQTESGVLMVPSGTGIGQWNWLSPIPPTEKFLKFEKVGDNMYHLVVLPGLPALKISDRPDGSYGTKDIFRPHPDNLSETDTRAGQARWKFVGRQGDIIVLVNGENADATPIEQKVILSPLVEMAIAFGAGHERLGLLVIPSQKAAGLSKEELIQSITPALELGNTLAAEYARISPDDIIVKPIGTPYPLTAKMTLQRPIMHQIFSEDIEAHYAAREQADVNIALSDEDVYGVVRRIVEEEVQKQAAVLSSAEAEGESTQDQGQIDDQTDFFSMGMDSLRASLIRGRLLREIPLPKGTKLAANVVFDYPNLGLLSDHIKRLRQSSEQDSSTVRDPAIIARAMVKKYTDLVTAKDDPKDDRVNGTTEKAATDNSHVIVLTGATGYLGAQLLKLLLSRPDVSRVYCLVRTRQEHDHKAAAQRVRTALDNSLLSRDLGPASMDKLICLSTNLAAVDLGLSPAEYGEIKASATAVIHNAWSVNFNMNLESFEPNIASVAHLLKLAQGPAIKDESRTFVFISSIAAVGGVRGVHGVQSAEERIYAEFKEASPHNGYGQSKWVAEQICATAPTSARVLRVGQVSGDTNHGIWNPAEAIPAMVQSALTVGALPRMEEQRNSLCWLPSDITAAVITDLTTLPSSGQVFHVASPHTSTWNEDVLPAIEAAGIEVRIVPQREWVRVLEESDSDIEANPPYKLIQHFRQLYGGGPRDVPEEKPSDETAQRTNIAQLDLTQSLKASPSLRNAPRVDSALVERYVRFWLKYWTGEHRSLIEAQQGRKE